MEVSGNQICFVPNILQNTSFYVAQKTESLTGLEQQVVDSYLGEQSL